ncbi:MAG: O-antigen ligase family protein [Solirubrobacteraceae bacterium]
MNATPLTEQHEPTAAVGLASMRARRPQPDLVTGLALGALLVLLAFATGSGVIQGSGFDLGANTWAEIAITIAGAGALIGVLLYSARGPGYGAGALIAFVALTVLTAVSIAWSVQPDVSWGAANQGVAYLATFGAAIALARLFPERWPALAGAVALLTSVICGYALLAKVFPSFPNSDATLGRVTAPLGYWNAIGLLGALGLPVCLWLGSRREHPVALRAATIPAISLLGTVVVLSYSRSALIAAVVALVTYLALVPTPSRMRAALVLLPGLAGVAVLSIRALGDHTLSDNFSGGTVVSLVGNPHPLAARTAAGHSFGWVLLAVMAVATIGGYALVRRAEGTTLSEVARRRVAIGLLVLVALVPVAGVAKLVTSQRGLTGEISHVWDSLTSTKTAIGTGPNRIATLANSRPRYWRDAITVGRHHLLFGAGALGYATARNRYTPYHYPVQTAHGYLFQIFADLGLAGLAVSLALLGAWSRAAWTTIGRGGQTDAEERTGLLALFAVIVGFGVHSAIDWTWFVPATAIPALICAGWLAGRGPLSAPVGRVARRRQILSHPALPLSVTAIVVVALALTYAIWQPLRAVQADDAAVSAVAARNGGQALTDARDAVSYDPLSLDAISTLASVYDATRQPVLARAELVLGTTRQPENYRSWLYLGEFDLHHGRPRAALVSLGRAAHLNPADYSTYLDLGTAGAAVKGSRGN